MTFLFFFRPARKGEIHVRETDTLITSADRGGGVVMACAAEVLAVSREAEATFPGKNVKIAYQDWFSFGIYTINPNGSGKTKVTTPCVSPSLPDYSPTSKKITYTSCEGTLGDLGISTRNVGGRGKFRVTHVTPNNTDDQTPSYSPDGKKIVFAGASRTVPYLPRTYDDEIYTMSVNGKNRVRLTNNATYDYYLDYSPNGRRITFAGSGENGNHIYTIRAHGGDESKVTKGYYASYSPNGKKLAYSPMRLGAGGALFTGMNRRVFFWVYVVYFLLFLVALYGKQVCWALSINCG